MQDANNRGNCKSVWEFFRLPALFFCKPETALRNKNVF